jgi:hypothetical protein
MFERGVAGVKDFQFDCGFIRLFWRNPVKTIFGQKCVFRVFVGKSLKIWGTGDLWILPSA